MGIPEPVYRPGVRLGEIRPATVAAQAGLRQGDVLLRVGDLEVAPAPSAVQDVVTKIKCAFCYRFSALNHGCVVGSELVFRALLRLAQPQSRPALCPSRPRHRLCISRPSFTAGTTPGGSW